jgi:hypothetical protein
MRVALRLLGGIWLATLLVTGGFAYQEIREERARIELDAQRRASLAADAVREATERFMVRGARPAHAAVDRVSSASGAPIGASPSTTSWRGSSAPRRRSRNTSAR